MSAGSGEFDVIGSKFEGSITSWISRAGKSLGEIDSERPCKECVELCALGFELDGIRFFLSLLGCFLSLSPVGDLKNPIRSRDGVVTSDCFSGSPSNLSWLVTTCEEGAKLDVPVAVGAYAGDDGERLRFVDAEGAAGDSPRGAAKLDEPTGTAAVGEDEPECFCIRLWGIPGDLLEGTVLLR